jgi:hypothetical protein
MALFLMILRSFVAYSLYKRSNQTGTLGLKRLSQAFTLFSLAFIGIIVDDALTLPGDISVSFLFFDFMIFGTFFFILFIEETFYKGRKSIFKTVMRIYVPGGIICGVLTTISGLFFGYALIARVFLYQIYGVIFGILVMLIVSWLFIAAFEAYKEIKEDDNVEPWIKMRYKITIVYAINTIIIGALFVINPFDTTTVIGDVDITLLFINLLEFIQIFGEFFAWYMPSRLKRYFNRKYIVEETEELSEEEIIKQLRGE